MIITIASGKGGTGKTTVATNLAFVSENPVRLFDCDVEAPNAHLFLPGTPTCTETVAAVVPRVVPGKCSGCGLCEEICQFSAINLVLNQVMIFPEMCHSCEGCLMVCPEGALEKSGRELGEIEVRDCGNIELVFGRLRIGEAMSPPLIDAVKQRIDDSPLQIVDAPPGTSCPVIAALRGSDSVVLVTEPTPFGLNDLVLAVEAVRALKLPFGIVINRAREDQPLILDYARTENIQILGEIPDMRKIAEVYSTGRLPAQEIPEVEGIFKGMLARITEFTRSHAEMEES